MAIQEEYLRIINEVRGIENFEQLKIKLQELDALQTQINEKMPAAQRGFRNTGYAALELSRGIEDLQYGFNGIVNNIPGIVLALGGTAGLTAVISLLSVGVNQLVRHWGDISEAFGSTSPKIDAARTSIDNLKRSIEENDEGLKSLQNTQIKTNEQVERYNELTEKAERLTREKSKADQEAHLRQKERATEEGVPEISGGLAKGLAGLAPTQVTQARIGLIAAGQADIEPLRARLRQAQARLDAHPGVMGQVGGPLDPEGNRLLAEYDRALAAVNAAQGGLERGARTTVAQAQAGQVPAFGRLQAAARAQPAAFAGLEGFLGPQMQAFGVQDAEDLLKPVTPLAQGISPAGANLRERQRALAARRQRDEREQARQEDAMAQGAINRERARQQNEAQEARRQRAAERDKAREQARQQAAAHREVGAELAEEGQAGRAGEGAARTALQNLARQQAKATGQTVENQMRILQQNAEVQQYLQMVANQAAMVRRMVIQQQQQMRRQREEARNEQRNGDSY